MHRRVSIPTGLLFLIAATGGCSGTHESAGSSASASTGAPSAAVHLALEVSTETRIAVRVTPKSTCTLAGGDADGKIFADDFGSLFFNVKPTKEGAGTVAFDCVGDDGATTQYPLELEGTRDPAAIAETKAKIAPLLAAKTGTLRPALEGDPLSYTDDEILARGYGPRPDPVREAGRYSRWLRAVSEPCTVVSSRQAADTVSNGPNENLSYGDGWSGAVASNPRAAWPASPGAWFWYAAGEWLVPQVFAESSAGNRSDASTWVGIGGTTLWQGGTTEWTQSALWFEIAGYNEWTQFIPTQTQGQVISNFNVNNGDDIFVEAYICKSANGAYEPVGSTGTLCVHSHNYTQNEDNVTQYTPSLFWTLNIAEAIQERPSGGALDYAQFNAFSFKATEVCSTNGVSSFGGCTPLSEKTPFPITMDQIGSPSHVIGGSCIADSDGNCDDSGNYVRVWWNSHN